jgi:membrane protein YdbS with pleckstrin-like domain
VLDLHPSGRRLVVPFVAVPVLAGLVTYALLRPVGPAARGVVLVAALVLLVVLSVAPYLRWRSTRYVVTTRRVLGRAGMLRHVRDDLPLSRIDEVHAEFTLIGRLVRAGDLVLDSDGPSGGLRLVDVPRVERVAAVVTSLLPRREEDPEEDPDEDPDEDGGDRTAVEDGRPASRSRSRVAPGGLRASR